MGKPIFSTTDSVSMRQQLLMGCIVSIAGVLVIALALGAFHAPESSFHAPHWVVGAAGGIFLLGGLSILAPFAITGYTPEEARTPGQKRAIEYLQQFFGCLLLTCFAAVFCWVGFGPGERTFSTVSSGFGLSVQGHGSATTGRVIFGGMGVLVAIAAAFVWLKLLRTVFRKPWKSD